MAEAIVDMVRDAIFAQENFGNKVFLYQENTASRMSIDRSALHKMLIDMSRTYESNGLLAGNVDAAGAARFSRYYTVKGQVRGPKWTYVDAELYKRQLDGLRKEGFDAVLHIHLHPSFLKSSYLPSQAYRMLEQTLDQADKKALAEYYESSMKCGFSVSMLGIVMQGLAGNRHAMYMNAFDFADGSKRVEGYALSGEKHGLGIGEAFSAVLRKGHQKLLMKVENRLSVEWKGFALSMPAAQMERAFADAEEWRGRLPQRMQGEIWVGQRKDEEELVMAARIRNRKAVEAIGEFTDRLRKKYPMKSEKRK